jgi:hypothetical protein
LKEQFEVWNPSSVKYGLGSRVINQCKECATSRMTRLRYFMKMEEMNYRKLAESLTDDVIEVNAFLSNSYTTSKITPRQEELENVNLRTIHSISIFDATEVLNSSAFSMLDTIKDFVGSKKSNTTYEIFRLLPSLPMDVMELHYETSADSSTRIEHHHISLPRVIFNPVDEAWQCWWPCCGFAVICHSNKNDASPIVA